ncbi:MAG: efflux RND transporter periplasmic adaptor subunit [Burkholderiales bacterium]|nr:efflux RND transporter periplasmic adaptor subunit [Burkholderiales bacterium]MBZ0248647.1 efflux RND transporter periplasmic adaptor subunit [Burkholderiales bacterium]
MIRRLLRPRLLVPLLVVVATAGGYAWWRSQPGAAPAERWRLEAVDRGDVVQVVSANGTVNPVTSVNVGTQVSGSIVRLHADFNSEVKEGQLLAELDPALFNAALAQSEANLNAAQAGLRLAQTKEARTRSLVGKGFISQAELDTAVKELEAAQAQVELVRAQVARDRTNLRYTIIRSPISGVVVARNVELGQTVAASFNTPTLFQIARDLSRMQIETSIAEADIGGIREGLPARFRVDAFPGQFFRGEVRQVRLNPTIQSNVVSYTVIVSADNPEGRLKPGMTAFVQVTANRRDGVLRVPNAALRFRPPAEAGQAGANAAAKGGGSAGAGRRDAGQRVYKLVDGKLAAVPIQVGVSDTSWTEVTGGDVKEGDRLVTRDLAGQGGPQSQVRLRMF